MSLGIPSTFTFKAVRNSELCRDCATALDVGTICLFFHGKMWGKGCRNVGFRMEKHVSFMSTLCFFGTVVFFIPGDVAPEAQTRCEKMGAVGTVVWFTIYAQTDSSAWGFKKGLRWLGPPFGEITCVFFGCL